MSDQAPAANRFARLPVPVTIEDVQGITPMAGYMEMAWLPQRKPG